VHGGSLKGFALDELVVEALEVSTALRGTDEVLGASKGCWCICGGGGAEMGSRDGKKRWLIHGLAVQRWSYVRNKEEAETNTVFMAEGKGIVKPPWSLTWLEGAANRGEKVSGKRRRLLQ